MKFPVINNNGISFPENPICPICKKKKIFEPHNFVCITGYAFPKKNSKSKSVADFEGFLNIVWHGNHYEDGRNEDTDLYVTMDIVKKSKAGQYELYFCSVECLRKFFNTLCNEFERKVTVAKRNKS